MHNEPVWSLRAVAQLTRPHIALLAALYALLGSYLGSGLRWLFAPSIWFAALAVYLIVGSGYATNAYCDEQTDRIGHPERPLPEGRVSRRQVALIALLLAGMAVVSAALAGPLALVIALANLILSALYSFFLKNTVLWGNVVVSYLVASIVLYGGLAAGTISTAVITIFALMFLYTVAQEVLYTMRDQKGDALSGLRTISTQWGLLKALWFFRLAALAFIAAAIAAWYVGIAPASYLYAMLVCTIFPLVGVILFLGRDPTHKRILIASRIVSIIWILSVLPVILVR